MTATVQFYMSKPAAAAIHLDQLRSRLAARGMDNHFEQSTFRTQGRVRVTCKGPIADVILEELREAATSAQKQEVRDECQRAIESVTAAIALSYDRYSSAARHDGPSDAERGILGA